MKITLYLSLLAFALVFSSCQKEEYCGIDTSHSGSISFYFHDIGYEVVKNGGDPEPGRKGNIQFVKKGKNSVSCSLSIYGDIDCSLEIESPFRLGGKPFDVIFDVETEGLVVVDGGQKTGETINIAGWMKRRGFETRCSPAWPDYNCDLSFDFTYESDTYRIVLKRAYYNYYDY